MVDFFFKFSRLGKLHLNAGGLCPIQTRASIEFWKIDELMLGSFKFFIQYSSSLPFTRSLLCTKVLSRHWRMSKGKEMKLKLNMLNRIIWKESDSQKDIERSFVKRLKDEDFGNSILGKIRKKCWNLTEYPETSLAARVLYTGRCQKKNHAFQISDLCIYKHGGCCSLHSCVHIVNNAWTYWWYWHGSLPKFYTTRKPACGKMGEGLSNCEKIYLCRMQLFFFQGIIALSVLDHLTMVFFTLGSLRSKIKIKLSNHHICFRVCDQIYMCTQEARIPQRSSECHWSVGHSSIFLWLCAGGPEGYSDCWKSWKSSKTGQSNEDSQSVQSISILLKRVSNNPTYFSLWDISTVYKVFWQRLVKLIRSLVCWCVSCLFVCLHLPGYNNIYWTCTNN